MVLRDSTPRVGSETDNYGSEELNEIIRQRMATSGESSTRSPLSVDEARVYFAQNRTGALSRARQQLLYTTVVFLGKNIDLTSICTTGTDRGFNEMEVDMPAHVATRPLQTGTANRSSDSHDSRPGARRSTNFPTRTASLAILRTQSMPVQIRNISRGSADAEALNFEDDDTLRNLDLSEVTLRQSCSAVF